MKKISIVLTVLVAVGVGVFIFLNQDNTPELTEIEQARQKHAQFLANSPFSETKNLDRIERKKLGLPPNAYNERLWELTMDPRLGYPTPFKVEPTTLPFGLSKGSPGTSSSAWVERGPRNVGGRTRVVFYDPNDVGANNDDGVDYNRVFAGAVGGGLWVNDNINSPGSQWRQVPGLAASLNISAYAIDPNDSNVFYLGTGEQYTSGAAVGNGLYKSTDGGDTWQAVNIPVIGGDDFADTDPNGNDLLFKSGIFNINDIIARDVAGTTEVYVGVGASTYESPNFTTENPENFLGVQNAGIYRSDDGGDTWTRNEQIILNYFDRNGTRRPVVPNDFEVAANNRLYMGSIDAPEFRAGGGRIYSSSDGITWQLETTLANVDRVELATSSTDENKIYVLGNESGQAAIFKTTDAFSSTETLSEPNDADNGIPATDFTRGQAFYDLVIEVNPTDDEEVFVGGINIHRSQNGGTGWTQLSKWSNNPNMDNLNVPFVHADIHAITFQPNSSTTALVGSDGGVSLANNLSNRNFTSGNIQDRILNYNVTQFYYGDIAQANFDDGGDFVGGTQDNGSPTFVNSIDNGNLTGTFDPIGGDGSYSAIDDDGDYAILGVTSRNHFYFDFPIPSGSSLNQLINSGNAYVISQANDGDFINVAELDSNFDVFYANSRTANGVNSITACELGPDSADCEEITGGALSSTRATAMTASPFAGATPTLFVGTQDSKLLRISNANSQPARVIVDISGDDFLGSVSDIEFGATELEIYLTMHNYGVNNIWYTQDGGVTWDQKDGDLPDIPVKAILQNPLLPNEVIIGTEQGVYATSDFDSASPTWVQTINGMTSVKVYDLDLRTADNTILATTHGRGMFTGQFTTAGIDEVSAPKNLVSVFPTQTASEIFLQSDAAYSDVDVTIYNLNGQQVYQTNQSISNNAQPIDVSTLSTGFYLLQMKGAGVDQTTKFIKE
jgi:photosystem II stability/assembly factor-like uncharacterized protein